MFASRSRESDQIKGVLKIWDAASGTPISMVRGSGFAITNDFSTVASFKGDVITLHNVVGTEEGGTFTTHVEIFQVVISSENNRIAAILSDGTVCLWDSRNSRLVGSYQDDFYGLGFIQFSPTGARLVYSSAKGIVQFRDAIDGTSISHLVCGAERISFSRDGSRIATLGGDSVLNLWSCEDGSLVGTAESTGHYPLAISADGSLVAIGSLDNVTLWGENSGKLLILFGVPDLSPLSMIFAPNGSLAIATPYGMKIYDIKSRSFISTFPFTGWTGSPLAFSPDSSRLVAGNSDGTVYLWDIQGFTAPSSSLNEQTNTRLTALALSPNCSRVACGFRDGTIMLWETRGISKQLIVAHRHHEKPVTTLGFSPDGNQFASGSHDGTIKLWEGKDGTLHGVPSHLTPSLYAVEFSNTLLATLNYEGIFLWDRTTLVLADKIKGSFGTPLTFSVDGTLLVASINDTKPPRAPTVPIGPSQSRGDLRDTAIYTRQYTTTQQIIVLNLTRHTTIANFTARGRGIHMMEFLPDNLRLIMHLYDDDYSDIFLVLNLVNKDVTRLKSKVNHLIQLPNMPLWRGVPVWVTIQCEQLRGLFLEHGNPVPLLWISRELNVQKSAKGRSMIVLGCENGRLILLRLRNN